MISEKEGKRSGEKPTISENTQGEKRKVEKRFNCPTEDRKKPSNS